MELSKIHKNLIHLLIYTHDNSSHRQSLNYLHDHIKAFYKTLTSCKFSKLNLIGISKFHQFINLSTQFLNALMQLQNFNINALFVYPLHHIFYQLDNMLNIVIKFINILSTTDTRAKYNTEVIHRNQVLDLQHIKIILSTLKMSGSLSSNTPDVEYFVNFYLDFINNYFEKHYDEVSDIIKSLNMTLKFPNDEIKQIKKELSSYKSINIPIDEIKITKKIDSDLFSTLYRATRLTTGEILTIKEINTAYITKDIWISIYSNLVQMCIIKHPFILDFVGGSFNEPYRIMTRFCEGDSLFELLHKPLDRTLSNLHLTKIAYQIAEGMNFLHSNGVAHFDLNSSNILIDDEGVVKIANLGLSGMIYSKNCGKDEIDLFLSQPISYQLIGNLGKPNYMAPEVLENKKITPKADIYSYGIILWELAMKQIPFNKMSFQEIFDHVVSKNRRLPIKFPISTELIKLINSCWSENPNDRPEFSEIVDLFLKGKVKFEGESTQNLTPNGFNSKIPLDYEYVELILKNPSNVKFPILVKFLMNNMTSEIREKIRLIYSLSIDSILSFASLFLSFASSLNFDSLVLLASRILNDDEFPQFIKLCGMNIIHSMSIYSSISLLASFAEFFSKVPDNKFDTISEYIPLLVDRLFNPSTLTKVSFSFPSKLDPEIPFYILHFLSRLDHSKYLMNRRMQVYLYFSSEIIESIEKQNDIDAFAKILPLIEDYFTYEQIDSLIKVLKKNLIVPFSVFEFLLRKKNKERLNNMMMTLLESSLTRDIESTLFDILQIYKDDDFDCFLTSIDDIFEIIFIMVVEKISLKVALFILSHLTKHPTIRNYILNDNQISLLDLILDTDNYFEMKLEIFTNLYSNENFCSEMQKNPITSKIIGLILNSYQKASKSSITSILSFILALSTHQIGCQILNDEDLLQTFSYVFLLASQNDLPLSLKIIINITNARMEIPQSSLIVSCLMNDLLQSKENLISILIALCNIISSSFSCVQEIDLQHSIMPLLSVDVEPKIVAHALQLFSVCEIISLKNLYAQLTEKVAIILSSSSSMLSTDIVLSSINVLNLVSVHFNLKPFLDELNLIDIIDNLINSFKEDFPKIAEQLLNLKNRLIA